MACLDTTILIELLADNVERCLAANRTVQNLLRRDELLTTTRFNVAELYVGAMRSPRPRNEVDAIESLLENLVILDFRGSAAWTFAEISTHLRAAGRPIGDMDALIAATALANGQSIVTRNVAHVAAIPNLVVEEH